MSTRSRSIFGHVSRGGDNRQEDSFKFERRCLKRRGVAWCCRTHSPVRARAFSSRPSIPRIWPAIPPPGGRLPRPQPVRFPMPGPQSAILAEHPAFVRDRGTPFGTNVARASGHPAEATEAVRGGARRGCLSDGAAAACMPRGLREFRRRAKRSFICRVGREAPVSGEGESPGPLPTAIVRRKLSLPFPRLDILSSKML